MASSDYVSRVGGGVRGMAHYARSVSIPKRVGAAYQGGRTPATVAARIAAQLVDWLLLLPVAVAALLVWAAVPEATGGAVRLAPVLAFAGVLSAHWLHALGLEGGAAAGTLGKRLVGLEVVTGRGGAPLGAGPAFLRRAIADLWLCGGVWCAMRLTSYRQYHDFFAPEPFAGGDWGVFALFVLVFYVPWFGYRASAFGCQWPHDRVCGAVVVSRVKQPAPVEARPVAPLPPAPEPAGAAAGDAVGAAATAETTALFAAAQRQAASIGAPPVAQPRVPAAQPPVRRQGPRIPPAPAPSPQPKSLAAKSPPAEGDTSAAAPARTPPPAAGASTPAALPAARSAAGSGSLPAEPIDTNPDADVSGDGDDLPEEESNDS